MLAARKGSHQEASSSGPAGGPAEPLLHRLRFARSLLEVKVNINTICMLGVKQHSATALLPDHSGLHLPPCLPACMRITQQLAPPRPPCHCFLSLHFVTAPQAPRPASPGQLTLLDVAVFLLHNACHARNFVPEFTAHLIVFPHCCSQLKQAGCCTAASFAVPPVTCCDIGTSCLMFPIFKL